MATLAIRLTPYRQAHLDAYAERDAWPGEERHE